MQSYTFSERWDFPLFQKSSAWLLWRDSSDCNQVFPYFPQIHIPVPFSKHGIICKFYFFGKYSNASNGRISSVGTICLSYQTFRSMYIFNTIFRMPQWQHWYSSTLNVKTTFINVYSNGLYSWNVKFPMDIECFMDRYRSLFPHILTEQSFKSAWGSNYLEYIFKGFWQS